MLRENRPGVQSTLLRHTIPSFFLDDSEHSFENALLLEYLGETLH